MAAADRRRQGAAAEAQARRHLERNGLRLIDCNVSARGGELDLVMDHGGTLVIVEVRARADGLRGSAAESVTARKRTRILRATRVLLMKQPVLSSRPIRFDVVTFDGTGAPEWIQGAFDAAD